MYGRSVPKEDEDSLREIIRSVDKDLDYSLLDGSDASGPAFTLHLTKKGWKGDLNLRLEDLKAAKSDLVCRNKIRQKIKRLRDHMWDGHLLKDVLGTKAARMLKESGQKEDAFKHQFVRRSPRR